MDTGLKGERRQAETSIKPNTMSKGRSHRVRVVLGAIDDLQRLQPVALYAARAPNMIARPISTVM
jgi:hypothetical protein